MQPVQPRARHRHNDAALPLGAQVLVDRLGHRDRAIKIHRHDAPEILQSDAVERFVLVDARVVHQRVDPAPATERSIEHALTGAVCADIVMLGDGLPTGGEDGGDDRLGGRGQRHTVRTRAHPVVDHNAPAECRKMQGVRAAEAGPCTRDDDDGLRSIRCLDHG